MSFSFTVDINLDGMEKRLSDTALKEAQESFAIKAGKLMTEYVPRRENILRPSLDDCSDYKNGILTWGTPYAHYQYELRTKNRYTAGTDGHWDELMAKNKMDVLKAHVVALLEGKR